MGNKHNKVGLIDAHNRTANEIVAYICGKRDLATAQKLKKSLKALGVTYNGITCNGWESLLSAFKDCLWQVGKRFTVSIESNNKKLSNLSRCAFRKTYCFSKR